MASAGGTALWQDKCTEKAPMLLLFSYQEGDICGKKQEKEKK